MEKALFVENRAFAHFQVSEAAAAEQEKSASGTVQK
jgi:hypothetical protein